MAPGGVASSRKFIKVPKTPIKTNNSPMKMVVQDVTSPLNATTQNMSNVSVPSVARVPKYSSNKKNVVRMGSPEAVR